MKAKIHPQYREITVTCSCGNSWTTRSTLGKDLHIEVCSACHPFFTGKQKIVDPAGRVERFTAKYKNVQPAQKKEAPAPIQPRQVIPKTKPVVPIAAPKPSEMARTRGRRGRRRAQRLVRRSRRGRRQAHGPVRRRQGQRPPVGLVPRGRRRGRRPLAGP